MIKTILFIAIIFFFLLCNLLSFLTGVLVFKLQKDNIKRKDTIKTDEKEENKIKKAKREYENFMTYNGDEQK